MMIEQPVRKRLDEGIVIPASPLALDQNRKWDMRRQRALWRYYSAAGAGGIAVGVHTTQFAIRDSRYGLFEPLLELAGEECDRLDLERTVPLVRIAGICGRTAQAVAEATRASARGFHFGLLGLAAFRHASLEACVEHCRTVADHIPLFGFYLQPAVGGRILPYRFWREFLEIEAVAAIKVAAFNRYQTFDVVRALVDSGRNDVALYTGNDDNFVMDLLTAYHFVRRGRPVEKRFVGGLLGHWACWTRRAVELLARCHEYSPASGQFDPELWEWHTAETDANAAIFDAAHDFAGCIPGVHEILRRQGLLEGTWCLDDTERLSPGQQAEIDRVYREYPMLNDDTFVARHLDKWLAD